MSRVSDEGMQIMVALVGGRRLREQCLARFLEMSGVCIRIGVIESLRESLVCQEGAIDLAIIDTGYHTCSDQEITTIIACLGDVMPGVPVVVISDREDWSAASDALNHGVRAYFPSSLDPEILVETLRLVHKGGTFIPVEVLIKAPVHCKPAQRAEHRRIEMRGLTPSEQRVLELLRTGQPNKAIARELNIGESTVKVHVRRIMKKLNVANRTQAALAAQQMADAAA
jgi:DNA-binding NarL/FixJ family response regulator